ncbi:radical SAM protein [Ruminococcus sp. NK3A76]|uniref:radical SAM/SPASM domain-containing protein n=1 Tax=Ruminococcus sp. NK3A76 TaxID=877411 RepID=UPI00048F6FFC|nr:radical SAM protein [Ruminococcus sp. NK3A76]
MNKQINLLIMPSNRCNMKCIYCFHGDALSHSPIMSLETFKKTIDVAAYDYETIQIVWHGGEPLMTSMDFYEKAYSYCQNLNTRFLFSIQTNATLINDKWIELIKKTNTKVGVSFDGITNEKTRGHSDLIRSNILKIKESGINIGCILVVSDINVGFLKENYSFFKELGVSVKFNPLFCQGNAEEQLSLSYMRYAEAFVELFKLWLHDTECNINLQSFYDILNLITTRHTGVCSFNSCLGSWLCIDYKGDIFPCDRFYFDDYYLNNIHGISSFNEAFNSDNYISLLSKAINRRNICKADCHYYEMCHGGCNATASLGTSVAYPNKNFCDMHTFILSELVPLIDSIKGKYPDISINPRLTRYFQYNK